MPNKEIYEYAVIRFVPKVEREEFLNVGVILFSKRKNFLGIKYIIDKKKLETFAEDIAIDLVEEYLKAWELICNGGPNGGSIGQLELPVRYRWLTAPRSTIIQSSHTHPGLCHEPKKVLENLFERYVL